MTQFTVIDIPTLHRRFIGFDEIFEELNRTFSVPKQDNYPPHNVLRKGENQFEIELAVAGFDEDELDVSLSNRVLRIRGEQIPVTTEVPWEYLHRGIAARDFDRTFPLGDNVEVRGVTVRNGIMRVSLELVVPEDDQAKKIAITFSK